MNKGNHTIKFPLPVGDYTPGYIYGNAKIHKNKKDPPLRPIISQIGTVTYDIGRKLKEIITPYMPTKYMINSTSEFIDITKNVTEPGLLASLDVCNLFTNVPVNETIDIIINCMFNNPGVAPPPISKDIIRDLLKICTEDAPFRGVTGEIYQQKDGVSMGGPLSPVFANFYMAHLENNVLPTINKAPLIYTRYVDDIFMMIRDIGTLEEIKSKFEESSVLQFTYEVEERKMISFLDVKIIRENSQLKTTVYVKPTNSGECINYRGIAPERYKTGVIKTLLHRAFIVCSTWDLFHREVERLKQLFVNNNFPMKTIDNEIKSFLDKRCSGQSNTNINADNIKLFFKNQMSTQYKQQEESLKCIIGKNVIPVNTEKKVTLNIYYKNKTLKNLLIVNNPHKMEPELRSHVVYQYVCSKEACMASKYIGYTECSLTLRMRNHAQNGSILKHNLEKHRHKITTNEILSDVEILRQFNSKDELIIAEALLIKEHNPSLNGQLEGGDRVLTIF